MPGLAVEPLAFEAGGAPRSARYGDVYASRDGALGQALHVFLRGNGLPQRWAGLDQFVVIETGFGLGVNFMATWLAWREDPARCRRLHFVSVEAHPVAGADLLRAAPAPLAALAGELVRQWPPPVSGLHRLQFDGGSVTLTLALGLAGERVPDLCAGADAFYLDGFAPDRNPLMWEPPLLKALSRLARPGASLATWSTARAVREALAGNGFEVSLAPGYGAKRQMLAARYAPRYRTRRREPPAARRGARSAIVVGAGLAGASAALALARRGWEVRLLDRAGSIAAEASALPAGLLHPSLAVDDNLAARLSRAGFLYGLRQLQEIDPGQSAHRRCGVFELAGADPEAAAGAAAAGGAAAQDWSERLSSQHWPRELVRWCDPPEAAVLTGMAPRAAGLWFAGGAVVDAAAWCRAMAGAGNGRPIRWEGGCLVTDVRREGARWTVADARGRRWGADAVVITAALQSSALAALEHAPSAPVRGRMTLLEAPAWQALRAGVTGRGYVMPLPGAGRVAVGATYELQGEADGGTGAEALSDERAHQANVARLEALLEKPPPGAAAAPAGKFDAVRCVAPDRTPYAGAVCDEAAALARRADLDGAHLEDLPRSDGLYCVSALGSRGLSLAPLLGELVAALAEGEPLPVERPLAASVDPGRYLLRRLRRGWR